MIARMKVAPGTQNFNYLTPEDIQRQFTEKHGERQFITNPELVEWAKHARIGSRFQVDQVMYVKVKDDQDDPNNYYSYAVGTVGVGRGWLGDASSSGGNGDSECGGCGSDCSSC